MQCGTEQMHKTATRVVGAELLKATRQEAIGTFTLGFAWYCLPLYDSPKTRENTHDSMVPIFMTNNSAVQKVRA